MATKYFTQNDQENGQDKDPANTYSVLSEKATFSTVGIREIKTKSETRRILSGSEQLDNLEDELVEGWYSIVNENVLNPDPSDNLSDFT